MTFTTLARIRLNLSRIAAFVFLLLLLLLLADKCDCDDWEYSLVKNLLKSYDPSIRPSLHHNATLNVTFGLALAQIIDVVN